MDWLGLGHAVDGIECALEAAEAEAAVTEAVEAAEAAAAVLVVGLGAEVAWK